LESTSSAAGPGPGPSSGPGSQKTPRARLITYAVAGVIVLAALILGGRQAGRYVPQFAAWVEGLGVWGPVVFILGYAVATVAFIPGSLLTLAAGAIFGLARGTLYTFCGATLGASGAFLVARYLARRAIERKIAGNAKFAAIDRAVGQEGFKIVALLRLSPIFPFNLLNYSLGLTRVPFLQYFLASIAMLPGTLLYVYYGKAAGSLAAVAGGVKTQKGTAYWVTLVVGLLATIVVTTFITRLAGKALRQQIGETPPAEEPK
jgi:uncharacterized membrane protein YdjX (TVP38/TMEM64 family)